MSRHPGSPKGRTKLRGAKSVDGDARGVAHRVLSRWAAGKEHRVGAALDAAWAGSGGGSKLQDPRRKAAERGLALELVLGCVRHQGLLDRVVGHWLRSALPKQPEALAALRMGAYQLLFADRVPAHAAVDTAVGLAGHQRGLANAVLRRLAEAVRHQPLPEPAPVRALPLRDGCWLELPEPQQAAFGFPPLDGPAGLAARWSLPEWIVARWWNAHGADATRRIVAGSAATPGVHLRPVGCQPEQLAAMLVAGESEVEVLEDPPLLRWVGGTPPFGTPAFTTGRFAVQDPTPFRAVSAMELAAGSRVLDLCAAPGTKSMVLAERLGNEGRVYAYDPDPERRARISVEAERLGMAERIHVLDEEDEPEDYATYDAVLVDAPCSNTGVLARRVEVRHRIEPAEIERLAATQREILFKALELVKPGGQVLYTTCSIEPEENQAVVQAGVEEWGATVEREELVLPDPPHHDGGYFALLRAED